MKKYILFFGLILSTFSWSQERISTKSFDSLAIKADNFIGKDNLKNDYFSFKNVIKKRNSSQEYEYQNLSLGKIKGICITNPLQIVVFYEDFNSLVLLDNQLNEVQQINANRIETPMKIEAFGLASQNQVWLYDGFLQKISLYNFKTNTIKIISTPITEKIKDYHSDYNYFYWIDESNTFYSISIFGKIKNLGTIPDYDTIQVIDETNYIIKKNNELLYFNSNKPLGQKIDLNKKSFTNFFYTNGILSIFTNNQIINYKIDLP
ncbi:hypothetical protein [uncultured Flavobacterium sp.]|uniref:hypothetical protein n=1 Tax=uncultured Flavobacterium sp. TaxID=165435 RepID=UPI0030EF9369|tara:strand:- start:28980 stop:29768 length:789 start_codon:yes stop_codon:yes gene_type:complete